MGLNFFIFKFLAPWSNKKGIRTNKIEPRGFNNFQPFVDPTNFKKNVLLNFFFFFLKKRYSQIPHPNAKPFIFSITSKIVAKLYI